MASDPKSLSPATRAKVYTSFASDINLLTDADGGGDASRRIRVISGGIVACYFKDDPTTKVLIEYAAGDVDDVNLSKIGASGDGTTATKIGVYW